MKILFSPYGSSGNHGCENIVSATKKNPEDELEPFSESIDENIHYRLGYVCKLSIYTELLNHLSFKYLSAQKWALFQVYLYIRLCKKLCDTDFERFSEVVRNINESESVEYVYKVF